MTSNKIKKIVDVVEPTTKSKEIPAKARKTGKSPVTTKALSDKQDNNQFDAGNENLVSPDELAVQINACHAKAMASEEEALRNAWEAGGWLNKAIEIVKYGDWGKFLKQHCSDLGLTTVWRYRRLADGYSTVEELAGITLSEAYAKLGLITFESEPVQGDNAVSPGGRHENKKNKMPSQYQAVIRDVFKASNKFDVPASLSMVDKAAVKKLCITLEDVHGQNNTPSILGVAWQAKLDVTVTEWTEAERTLFKEEYVRLETVHKNVQAIAGEA